MRKFFLPVILGLVTFLTPSCQMLSQGQDLSTLAALSTQALVASDEGFDRLRLLIDEIVLDLETKDKLQSELTRKQAEVNGYLMRLTEAIKVYGVIDWAKVSELLGTTDVR